MKQHVYSNLEGLGVQQPSIFVLFVQFQQRFKKCSAIDIENPAVELGLRAGSSYFRTISPKRTWISETDCPRFGS